ncbi:putative invertase inhibitor [Elaeis guineensis]|uniref:Invertase inhibitor n=1 Tax=Elaeis guineensis var. tenera TaxID=51953 RepID=A0A6I9QB03_ELAGV|nr:putative invertase inhibitor [Elaeis guineensis]
MTAFVALLCFLLTLNQSLSLVNASVMETCKTIAASNPNINYNFCIATLSADPRSALADTQGLAIIATKLIKANATSTELTISNLLKKTTDNATSQCLSDCSSMYSGLVDTLNDAISAITSKHYLDANSDLSAAIDVSITCETGFAELKVKSPLTKENDDSRKLSTLALAITVLLK